MPLLYLCSSSVSRLKLLQEAGIPIEQVFPQLVEEKVAFSERASLEDITVRLAQLKIESSSFPLVAVQAAQKNEKPLFCLSADTLVQSSCGKVLGKPSNLEEAELMLDLLSKGDATVTTGVCIEKRYGHKKEQETVCIHSKIGYHVPLRDRKDYFRQCPQALKASGASVIDFGGGKYVTHLHGSPSAVIGLPLYEVGEILERYGFWSS